MWLPKEYADLIRDKEANYRLTTMHENSEQLSLIKQLVEDKKIKCVIDSIYPFTNSIEAILHLSSGRAKGKVIINYEREGYRYTVLYIALCIKRECQITDTLV